MHEQFFTTKVRWENREIYLIALFHLFNQVKRNASYVHKNSHDKCNLYAILHNATFYPLGVFILSRPYTIIIKWQYQTSKALI